MFIDSHCHLQDKRFSKDLDEIIKRASDNSVTKIITIGTNLTDSKYITELAEKYDNVYATVGIYPQEKIPEYDFRTELAELAKHKKVVAIGECGLDYSNYPHSNPKEEQKMLLRKQIGTAIQLDLPVVIHNRDADADLIEEVGRYKETGKLNGVFHCFTSDAVFARKVLDLGFYISLTAIITYPSAKHLEEVVKAIPLDKILIETDAPYLPPQEMRGQRNEPTYVRIVAEKVAHILGITVEEVAKVTSNNTQKLFKLN